MKHLCWLLAACLYLASTLACAGENPAAPLKLSYPQFLKLALQDNLDLKIESAKSEAARSSAGSLQIPPPMVGYMKMTDQSGSSADGIEISQMIPFPTKIAQEHSARKLQAEAQAESQHAREEEIKSQAKLVYVSLWVAQERLSTLEEKKNVIETHLKLSRATVRSDSFLRIHVLKAESDLDLLENDLISARQDVREKEIFAAKFINQDPTQFHPELETPELSQVPQEKWLTSPHQLESAKLTLESLKESENAGRSSWFPDLYLRYKKIGQTEMMPQTSEMMIGLSLPFVFPWDASAQSGKASAERFQAELRLDQEKLKINSERTLLLAKAEALQKQLDNINQKLLPRAERRMKLVHNLAPRDMETLQDQRETMEAFPDLKLKSLDLRERFEETIAELLKYARGDLK